MILLLGITALCSAAAVGVSIPLIRRYEQVQSRSQDRAVYQDQLEEVERDLQAGNINGPEAQAAKNEISRRLEATSKNLAASQPLAAFWRKVSLALTAGFVIIVSVVLYGTLGNPNLPSAAPSSPPAQSSADRQAIMALPPAEQQIVIEGMVQKLADRLKENPKNLEGWRRLMQAYVVLKAPSKAMGALQSAQAAFAGDQAAQDQLTVAAKELGLN